MADDRRPHDPTSCHLCKDVPAERYRRHWKHEAKAGAWHVIADGPDLLARVPPPAHFITVLAYRPGRDGSPTHYTGPFYFEFDAGHSADALNDLRRCLQMLEVEMGCPLEAIHVWHSGGRGYHVTIPALVIGVDAGHPSLPRIYAAMITRLFPASVAPTLDRGVYSSGKGRMWRLPNRQRSDTGRYKVPLSSREVLHKSYAELEALTVRRRKGIFWPTDEDLAPCPRLVQFYQQAVTAVMSSPAPSSLRPEGGRIPEGQGNATLASLASSMRSRGASEAAIIVALMAENRRCDPPLPEPEVRAIAASIAQYAPAVAVPTGPGHGTRSRPFRTILAMEVTSWRR
jgi:Primase C terminal 1 (PriCT-1)